MLHGVGEDKLVVVGPIPVAIKVNPSIEPGRDKNVVVIIMPWRTNGDVELGTMPEFIHQTGRELKLIEKAA